MNKRNNTGLLNKWPASIKKSRNALLFLGVFIPTLLSAQIKGIKHVILIGVDGMGANYLAKANIPVMKQLMQDGAYTLHARCVSPSSSADNWASMTMGAGPELHGYTNWDSKTPEIPSRMKDHYGMFPSIFGIMRDQKPAAKIGVVYSWGGIGYLFPKSAVNEDNNTNSDSLTTAVSAKYIITQKPDLLFIHFSDVDGAGHTIGWGTSAYYDAIHQVDQRIGEILKAVKKAGIEDNTIIIVSADHGGIQKGHGGKSIEEMEIPWIIYGRDIKKDTELNQSIMTFDTAATIAYIFGLKVPQVWIGRPVKTAFSNN